ncbi:transcription factor A, mitochondrial [Uranotaenia lowii]|uniref:transcription factor A, mitochondrial n=1 Tax=Uranotaenia lowii TaxID=190385 RepID=UPI0024797E57|nr:transcription factor A, mitochondrial [Uranotaenia lowii]
MQTNGLVRLFSPKLWLNTRTTNPIWVSGINTSTNLGFPTGPSDKLPERPKRPINAYLRFVQNIRSTLLAKNPKASPTDISKLASAQWQVLDVASKSKLEEEYKVEQAIWLQKNAKYLSQLTDQQKVEIRQARSDKAEEKTKRDHKKRLKELGKPKRPLNGFLLYCAERRPKNLTKEQNREQIKKLAEAWSKLGAAEKEPYNSRAADGLVKYRENMRQWEDEMIAQDNMDVIRRKNIIIPEQHPTHKKKASRKE